MSDTAPTTGADTCPQCGLTGDEIRTQGLMGCAACYRAFEDVVVQAARELHGVAADANLPPPPPPRPVLPWPTRRGETHPESPPESSDAPPRSRRPPRRGRR